MQTVADLRKVLEDCGDGVLVAIDGRPIATTQIEGVDPPRLNLLSVLPGAAPPAPEPPSESLPSDELLPLISDAELAEIDAAIETTSGDDPPPPDDPEPAF